MAPPFAIALELEPEDLPELLKLFASAWWAARRTETEVRRMLAGSDVAVFVKHPGSGRLVGFARALTDETFLAIVLDVIVAPDTRGAGVGAMLMDHIVRHPRIVDVNSVELVCQPGLMPFYRRWGFTEHVGQSRLMRRTTDPMLISGSHP